MQGYRIRTMAVPRLNVMNTIRTVVQMCVFFAGLEAALRAQESSDFDDDYDLHDASSRSQSRTTGGSNAASAASQLARPTSQQSLPSSIFDDDDDAVADYEGSGGAGGSAGGVGTGQCKPLRCHRQQHGRPSCMSLGDLTAGVTTKLCHC